MKKTAAQRLKIRKARPGTRECELYGTYYIADEGQPVGSMGVLIVGSNLGTMDAAKRERRHLIEQIEKGISPRSVVESVKS